MKRILLIWIVFLTAYLFISGRGKMRWYTTSKNYFSYQAESFLRGRIDLLVKPTDLYDLSVYRNKVYLYWPPLPAFFAMPFISLFGLGFSDIFYTAFWSSLGPVLLYMVLYQSRRAGIIPKISDSDAMLLAIFFGFGTVYFYLSVLGTVWFTSQVLSVLLSLLSLLFLFKYSEKKTGKYLIFSILTLSLAFWCRNVTLLALPLYIFIIIKTKNRRRMSALVISMFLVSVNIFLYGYYNFVRFGSFLETGFRHQQLNPRYASDLVAYGTTNVHYFPHNMYYALLHPLRFDVRFPFVQPDPEGNSIVLTSPLFILLPGYLLKRTANQKKKIFRVLFGTGCFILFALFLHFGTGWFQFGYRYSLDAMPILLLSLAWVINVYPHRVVLILLVLSVIINTLGTYWMMTNFSPAVFGSWVK